MAVSEYTPTTEEVRNGWASCAFEGGGGMSRAAYEDADWDDERAEAQFDRWLSQLLAEAWDEGYSTGLDYMSQWLDGDEDEPENPYREEN